MMRLALGLLGLAFAAQPATAAAPDSVEIAKSQAALAMKLLAPRAREPQAVVSPASLASAVAIVDLGASPAMKAALLAALSWPKQPAQRSERQLREARAALMQADPAVFITADRFVDPPEIPLSAAMLAKFEQEKVSHAALDLRTATGIAAVNDWVKQATRGEIAGILDQPFPVPTAVALNALYFKAKWAKEFDPKATTDAEFFDLSGGRGQARMMQESGEIAAREAPGFVGVELPFVGGRYVMDVVTTTQGPSPLSRFAPVGDWLAGQEFAPRPVVLSLPRFRLETGGSLMPALQADLAPGLASPAPFEGFGPNYGIGDIVQRAKVEVDEQGAKAAAVTAIVAPTAALRPVAPPLRVVVDKPFLFALRDRDSGLILLAGYVGEAPKD